MKPMSEAPASPSSGALQRVVYFMVKNSLLLWGLLFHRIQKIFYGNGHFAGGRLLVSNHQSNLDPGLIGAVLPCQSNFLAKKELFSVPVIGWIIKTCNGIPLDRGGVDRGALKRAIHVLRTGEKLLLFPEGTRSLDGQLGQGKPGAGMIAAMAGVPCVPIYIDGSGKAMPKGASMIRPHKIKVLFGEPFSLPQKSEGTSTKEYYQQCADEMMSRIAEVRDRYFSSMTQA